MTRRGLLSLCGGVLAAGALGALGRAATARVRGREANTGAEALLAAFHAGLTSRYPDVAHIDAGALQDLLDTDRAALFDVRPQGEFAVSRIEGAVRVEPGTAPADFLRQHGARIQGRTPVFYCSVGERSSRLAQALAEHPDINSAHTPTNLAGGLFAWHNGGRAVVDALGPTSCVHPFNRLWGRMLARRESACTRPR